MASRKTTDTAGDTAAATAKEADRRLGIIATLMAKQRECVENLMAITAEIDDLLDGRAGIGATMKRIETTFDAAWSARYGAGRQYVWNYQRDRGTMKPLIRQLGIEEIEQRIQVFMHSNDPHYLDARHSFPMFVATVNAHITAPLLAGDGIYPVVDCKHRPKCTSEVEHTKRRQMELRA